MPIVPSTSWFNSGIHAFCCEADILSSVQYIARRWMRARSNFEAFWRCQLNLRRVFKIIISLDILQFLRKKDVLFDVSWCFFVFPWPRLGGSDSEKWYKTPVIFPLYHIQEVSKGFIICVDEISMLGHECKELGPDCQKTQCPAKYILYFFIHCTSM